MHPQNRFWRMLCEVLDEPLPSDIDGRNQLCLRNRIALWDVLESCWIDGADDASIRDPKPNDLRRIMDEAQICAVFTTGAKAAALYKKYCENLGQYLALSKC